METYPTTTAIDFILTVATRKGSCSCIESCPCYTNLQTTGQGSTFGGPAFVPAEEMCCDTRPESYAIATCSTTAPYTILEQSKRFCLTVEATNCLRSDEVTYSPEDAKCTGQSSYKILDPAVAQDPTLSYVKKAPADAFSTNVGAPAGREEYLQGWMAYACTGTHFVYHLYDTQEACLADPEFNESLTIVAVDISGPQPESLGFDMMCNTTKMVPGIPDDYIYEK